MSSSSSFLEALRARFGRGEDPQWALVLSGGGARAAYQAGALRYIADQFPQADFPILTGVSAGSINAAVIANEVGDFGPSIGRLSACWEAIRADDVFEAPSSLDVLRGWLRREDDEGTPVQSRGLVDTAPLREFLTEKLRAQDGALTGVATNVRDGRLRALGIITTHYGTGQTVTWVQGGDLASWERPNRIGHSTELTVEHIMASTSLPFLFPAVRLGDEWHGDGGIRLAEPLSPAIHQGANRILAISTRYDRSRPEADEPVSTGYPPSAQIFGVLLSAVFLDRLEQDALTLERYNRLLRVTRRSRWGDLKPVRLLMLRPSVDLGRLSGEYQADLGGALGWLGKSLGSGGTKSPDWLSMILFDPDYTSRLLEIGYSDARMRRDDIERFLAE